MARRDRERETRPACFSLIVFREKRNNDTDYLSYFCFCFLFTHVLVVGQKKRGDDNTVARVLMLLFMWFFSCFLFLSVVLLFTYAMIKTMCCGRQPAPRSDPSVRLSDASCREIFLVEVIENNPLDPCWILMVDQQQPVLWRNPYIPAPSVCNTSG